MSGFWSDPPKPSSLSDHFDHQPHCPGCGTKLDAFTSIGHDQRPEAGDVSVCSYCGMALEYYGEGLLQLRRLTGNALIVAMADPLFRKTREVIDAMIRERQSYPGDGKVVLWWRI